MSDQSKISVPVKRAVLTDSCLRCAICGFGLPENLFYNTSAPGIVLFLHTAKPKARQGKVFLVNASQIFEKGNSKNFIPDDGIQRIADLLIGWQEEEKLSRIVDHAELKKNDYNISPSRDIHTSDAKTYHAAYLPPPNRTRRSLCV